MPNLIEPTEHRRHRTSVCAQQGVILANRPGSFVKLCGISVLERLLRTLQRCGTDCVILLSGTSEPVARELGRPSWARAELDVTLRTCGTEPVTIEQIVDLWPEEAEQFFVVPGDVVCDPRLFQGLLTQNGSAALVDSAMPRKLSKLTASAPDTTRGKLCGPAILRREWASGQTGQLEGVLRRGLKEQTLTALDVATQPLYYATIRRNLRPYWFPAPSSPGDIKMAERILLRTTRKGARDMPAIFHEPIETFLVSHLCRTSITPNQLTLMTNIVAWTATILFATGRLGWGLILALIVGVLDGLDGKQARLKIETTKQGKLEHWFDAAFEWSWWITLGFYFRASGQLPNALFYLGLLAVAEGVDGILKASVYFKTGKVIDELGVFERVVRLFGGRRNVYIWILAAGFLLGTAPKAFIVMAWLEVATATAHLPRTAWTFLRRRPAARLFDPI